MPLPKPDIFGSFDDAIAWFRKRVPMSREEWDTLSTQAREKAFTVSNVAQADVIQDVLDSLTKAQEDGLSLKEWKVGIREKLTNAWRGSVQNPASRLDTIFRTNIQTASSHGRVRQMSHPDVVMMRPYWLYDGPRDKRNSNICRKRIGMLLPADDPQWKTDTPPLHHQCRHRIRALRKRQAMRRGGIKRPRNPPPPAEGFGAAPTLDTNEQVKPVEVDRKYDPTLDAIRKRRDEQHKADVAVAQKEVVQRRRRIEQEAQRNPFRYEQLRELDGAEVSKLRADTNGSRCAGASRKFAADLSKPERDAVESWSYGYDWTIRQIQGDRSLSDTELLKRRRRFVEAGNVEEPETAAQSRQHIRNARIHERHLSAALERQRVRNRRSPVRKLYRGMSGVSGEDVKKLLEAGEFDMGGRTTSTSWSPEVARDYMSTTDHEGEFSIMLELGTNRGIPVESLSQIDVEREVLLHGDSRFRVTDVKHLSRDGLDTYPHILIKAEEI